MCSAELLGQFGDRNHFGRQVWVGNASGLGRLMFVFQMLESFGEGNTNGLHGRMEDSIGLWLQACLHIQCGLCRGRRSWNNRGNLNLGVVGGLCIS